MPSIRAECRSCNATGLYSGFAEPEGTAVVCSSCGGTGCQEITYKEFTKRKRKRGIRRVMTDGGLWFARGAGEQPTISVEEFYEHDPQLKKKEW